MLFIVFAYCLFHLLVLFGVLPFSIVWGGQVASMKTLYYLEGVAISVMLFLGFLIAMKNRLIKPIFSDKVLKRMYMVFALFFMLNTVGNLLAETVIEKLQAIITLFLSYTLFKSSKQIKPE